MRLQTKLISLVAGSIGLFAAAIPVYYVVLAPVYTIQAEQGYFQNLLRTGIELRATTTALAIEPIASAIADYRAATERYRSA